ncbi:MAG: ACT domain-containing protein [Limnochordia bacterium]|jgi:hypothetical protein
MQIRQLSVFLENKPGRLSTVCEALANAGINLVTLSLADTTQFGILRLIVEDWEKAKQVLEECGYAARVTDVLALEVEDRPGGLAAILKVVEQAGISVEYMYAFAVKCQGDAILVFRFDQIDKAIAALNAAGINCIEPHQLFARYHAENKELGE